MKKKNILKKSRDFDRIIKKIKPYKYKDYVIYLENTKNSEYQFGLAVPKKIGNAVTRNKIKRQLKSIIDKKDYKNNFNCIIIVGIGILNRNYFEMEQNLTEAIKTLGILKEKEHQNEEK